MKKFILMAAVVSAFGVSANAALAPGYNSLSKMDAAIAAIAKGSGKDGLATKNPGDVTVASAVMSQDKGTSSLIQIDVGNLNCQVKVTVVPPTSAGLIGAIAYQAKVSSCKRYMSFVAVEVMKYDDARPTLAAAAAQNKVNLSFQVVRSPQGPKVQLTGK